MEKKKQRKTRTKMFIFAGAVAVSVAGAATLVLQGEIRTDPESTSVMILNQAGQSGGSGVIIASSENSSAILTNKHVCEVVKAGGIAKTPIGDFQIQEYIMSESSDLCLASVAANLKAAAKIAKSPAELFDTARVVGHPTLLPTVSTLGHFAGRKTIEIIVGLRRCTPEERKGQFGLGCMIFGGMPLIRRFESNIVTATIMPGSSGSGVFNGNDELSGLVFAGMGGLSYAFTVPLEQIKNFLSNEIHEAPVLTPQAEFSLQEILLSRAIKKGRAACKSGKPSLSATCRHIEKSVLWAE